MSKETMRKRSGLSTCLFILFGAVLVYIYLIITGVAFYLPDQLQRLGKSFEFPTIEARAKPYSDLLVLATQDTLLEEDQAIDNVQLSMTHPVEYTGIVDASIKRIYGTNRPLETVQADFTQFLSTKSGWKADPDIDVWMAEAPYGIVCMRLKRAGRTELPVWLTTPNPTSFPETWAKYQTLYEVDVDYLDFSAPKSTCSLV